MKTYLVGGYVRDHLLASQGFATPTGDRDWVVVGSTPEAMVAAGYLPVGKDFPVFLHPKTHEEYALARTERKIGVGYHGFSFYTSPEITLEEDLRRRDLTINAMAQDAEGNIIDPYGGQADLEAKLLRHVSEAFVEDPVRILRVARFAARFPQFTVAPDTLALMQEMVRNGEADALVKERIWAELEKGFQSVAPHRMIDVLQACSLWEKIFPGGTAAGTLLAGLEIRDNFAALPLEERFALLVHREDSRQRAHDLLANLRAPVAVAQMAATFWEVAHFSLDVTKAESLATLYQITDALRQTERFHRVLALMTFLTGKKEWTRAGALFPAWRDIDAQRVAATHDKKSGVSIGEAIRAARLAHLQAAMSSR